jgi:hypothetical protein
MPRLRMVQVLQAATAQHESRPAMPKYLQGCQTRQLRKRAGNNCQHRRAAHRPEPSTGADCAARSAHRNCGRLHHCTLKTLLGWQLDVPRADSLDLWVNQTSRQTQARRQTVRMCSGGLGAVVPPCTTNQGLRHIIGVHEVFCSPLKLQHKHLTPSKQIRCRSPSKPFPGCTCGSHVP